MSPTTQQLLTTALMLPEQERLELAGALLASSEPARPNITGEAWLEELERRSDEIDAGKTQFLSWAEVKQQARTRLLERDRG